MEKTFEARTEQEAVELAVREFGVNAEFIEVEVLKASKQSLFNRNSKVVIKATVLGLPSSTDHLTQEEARTSTTAHEREEKIRGEVSEEIQERICDIVKNLVKMIGIEVDCSFYLEDNFYIVDMKAAIEEEQNLLIGKHGKNIEALQNICNSIIQTQLREFGDFIVLDIENYRAKRMDWLSGIARKKSEQVLQTGKSYLLDELGPFDRKLIHSVVKTFSGVSTISKGDSYYKRVKIFLE